MIVANGGTVPDTPLPGLRPLHNPDQQFGGGYDPSTGAMSLTDQGGAQPTGQMQQVPLASGPPPMPRMGMAFRGPGRGIFAPPSPSGMVPNDPSQAPTGIAGLDNAPALNLTPDTLIADGSKGGVNDRIHPKFFEHGGLGGKLAGIAGDVLLNMAAMGGSPMAMQQIQQRGADMNARRQFATWQAQESVRLRASITTSMTPPRGRRRTSISRLRLRRPTPPVSAPKARRGTTAQCRTSC